MFYHFADAILRPNKLILPVVLFLQCLFLRIFPNSFGFLFLLRSFILDVQPLISLDPELNQVSNLVFSYCESVEEELLLRYLLELDVKSLEKCLYLFPFLLHEHVGAIDAVFEGESIHHKCLAQIVEYSINFDHLSLVLHSVLEACKAVSHVGVV